MTEVERLKAALDRKSLKLSDAIKKISRLSLGEEVPRRLQNILCSTRFHLGIAMRWYKMTLEDSTLDEQKRKALQDQSNDCMELLGLLEFIRVPDKAKEVE